MNLLEEIAYHLEYEGFGEVSTTERVGKIFWGLMPDSPDYCICVFSTDSAYPGSSNAGRFQIVVRAKSVTLAYETACEITDALAEFNDFLHGDGAKAIIEVVNSATSLGEDEKKRQLYSSNYTIRYCDY